MKTKESDQFDLLAYLPGMIAFVVLLWWMDLSGTAWALGLPAMFFGPLPVFALFYPFVTRYELIAEACPACGASRHGAGLSPCRECGASAWPKERIWQGPSPDEWLRGGPTPGRRALVMIGVTAGSLILFLIPLPQYMPQFESAGWPKTDGAIISSMATKRNANGVEWAVPVVRYEYKVGPQSYLGRQINIQAEREMTLENAAHVLKPYPQGARVPVYYNPRNPGEAVLDPGIKGEQLAIFWIALFYVVALAAALIYAVKLFIQIRLEGFGGSAHDNARAGRP